MSDSNIIRRAPNGQLLKGSRIAPSKRTPALTPEERKVMASMLRCETPKALEKIIALMHGASKTVVVNDGMRDGSHTETVPDEDLQFKAALAILDRGLGKVTDQPFDYASEAHQSAFDMSKLTDDEIRAARVVQNGVERVLRDEADGREAPRRPIPSMQPGGIEAQIVDRNAHVNDPTGDETCQDGELTESDDS